jgi:hypothetical protein
MKRMAALLLFLLFLPSASLFIEPLSLSFAAEASSSFRADRQDLSEDDLNPISGVLGRHLRAKSPGKNLPVFEPSRQEISPAGWISERTFSPPSKSSVYQQINVYRI